MTETEKKIIEQENSAITYAVEVREKQFLNWKQRMLAHVREIPAEVETLTPVDKKI